MTGSPATPTAATGRGAPSSSGGGAGRPGESEASEALAAILTRLEERDHLSATVIAHMARVDEALPRLQSSMDEVRHGIGPLGERVAALESRHETYVEGTRFHWSTGIAVLAVLVSLCSFAYDHLLPTPALASGGPGPDAPRAQVIGQPTPPTHSGGGGAALAR